VCLVHVDARAHERLVPPVGIQEPSKLGTFLDGRYSEHNERNGTRDRSEGDS